jgi:hypothetical protein
MKPNRFPPTQLSNWRDWEKYFAYIFKKYKITREMYDKASSKQKGRCGICNKETALVPDHCHRTGKFRGLLCSGCNGTLGLFEKFCKKTWRKRFAKYLGKDLMQ